MKARLLLISFVFLAVGCGGRGGYEYDSDSSNSYFSSNSQSLSYEFEENGCKTGKQVYSSTSAYCAGLQSRSRNNNCAYTMRKNEHKRSCVGPFVETN